MIAIYIVTKNRTVEQHAEGRDRLREAGAPENAMSIELAQPPTIMPIVDLVQQ